MTLPEYLQQLAGCQFELGRCDCMLALADWVHVRSGVDVGAAWRGTYSTEAGWRALVAAAGSLEALIESVAPLGGLVRVRGDLQPGDIAVLNLPKLGQTGALWAGSRWVVKVEQGLWAVNKWLPVAAWRVS